MARIGLTGLPPHRPIETALTWLPGVSRARAKAILVEARIDPEITTESLSAAQLELVRQELGALRLQHTALQQQLEHSIQELEVSTHPATHPLTGEPVAA